jgi:hypothetical protein
MQPLQMSPTLAALDVADLGRIDAVVASDLFLRSSPRSSILRRAVLHVVGLCAQKQVRLVSRLVYCTTPVVL